MQVKVFSLILKYKGLKKAWSKSRKRPNLKQIKRWMKVADTPNILDLSDYELDQGYHLAQQALKAAKPLASQWRQEHLAALDKTHAAEQGKELDQITKSRKRMEYQRRLGRSLARVKGMQRDSVNTVLFTNQQGVQIACSTREGIEKACMEENSKRFTQTRGTPPMDPELCRKVGFFADKASIEDILHGTFDIQSTPNRYMRLVLEAMRMPAVVRTMGWRDTNITEQEHQWAWKRQ